MVLLLDGFVILLLGGGLTYCDREDQTPEIDQTPGIDQAPETDSSLLPRVEARMREVKLVFVASQSRGKQSKARFCRVSELR